MPAQEYTDAQLSDGTTLRFIGQLGPDEVRQKVAGYRRTQAARDIEANPPGMPSAVPKELQPGMTRTSQGAMPYSDAVAAGPYQPAGQAEEAMGFGTPASDTAKESARSTAMAGTSAAQALISPASLLGRMGLMGATGGTQSALLGGSPSDIAASAAFGAGTQGLTEGAFAALGKIPAMVRGVNPDLVGIASPRIGNALRIAQRVMGPESAIAPAAFQNLDSALSDVTPVTEQKFNIDRVANSARKVSNLKDAPPIAQKLLERASDATRPMSWPELRTFKTQLDGVINDPGMPSQAKGSLKNLATDIDATLRQGADARGQGEIFSKANKDFRKSLKVQASPPQELPEISPSQVRTTQPPPSKSSQLASARSVSGGSTPQTVGSAAGAASDTALFQQAKAENPSGTVSDWAKRAQELKTGSSGAEPEIEAIRRGASESVQPQQAKAAQVQQAKQFKPAGTSEQSTPEIWQSAKQRFEESEAKRAQSGDPEARKEAREKKTAEKLSQVKQGRKQEIDDFMRQELAKPNIPEEEDLTPALRDSLARVSGRSAPRETIDEFNARLAKIADAKKKAASK